MITAHQEAGDNLFAGVARMGELLAEERDNGFPRLYSLYNNVPPWDKPPDKEKWGFLLHNKDNAGWSSTDFLVGRLDEKATNRLRTRHGGSHRKGRANAGDTSAMSLSSITTAGAVSRRGEVHDEGNDVIDSKPAELLSVTGGNRCARFTATDLLGRINGKPVYFRFATCRNLHYTKEHSHAFQGTH